MGFFGNIWNRKQVREVSEKREVSGKQTTQQENSDGSYKENIVRVTSPEKSLTDRKSVV